MKLVIDIPEELYEVHKGNPPSLGNTGIDMIVQAIANGTPVQTGEWIEVKHRLNLLIGVLYSNQLISKSDLDYMDDSIKKLMKGEEE